MCVCNSTCVHGNMYMKIYVCMHMYIDTIDVTLAPPRVDSLCSILMATCVDDRRGRPAKSTKSSLCEIYVHVFMCVNICTNIYVLDQYVYVSVQDKGERLCKSTK